jgi:hypothetical protein
MKLMEKFRHEPRERGAREHGAEHRPEPSESRLSTADLAGTAQPRERVERAEVLRPEEPHGDVQWNAPRRAAEPAGKLSDRDVADAVEVARRDTRAEDRREARADGFADTQAPLADEPATAGDRAAAHVEPHHGSHGAQAAARRAAAPEAQPLAPLFTADVAQGFRSRWDATQIGFVDDPRQAVQQADELVAQVMKSLAQSFADERRQLEAQMHDERASTENLRIALQRYRSFFQRLLSL